MRIVKALGLIALLAVFIAFPFVFSDPAVTIIAVFTIFYAAAATGWNIFSGYSGYIALGHAAYFGIGSYAIALMAQDWNVPAGYAPFFLVPLGGLVAAIFAVPFGWIALRTRRHTFIVIMLALATSWWVRNSKYGLGLLAIRDDEDRALGLGVNTAPFKLIAFVISAFFVGMVGAVHAYFIGSVSPPFAFDALFDVAVALMAFLGGLGTLAGPLLGALILVPTQQYFTSQPWASNGYYLIVYGVLFLAIILLLPEGILPTIRKRWFAWVAARDKTQIAPAVAAVAGQEETESAVKKDEVNL